MPLMKMPFLGFLVFILLNNIRGQNYIELVQREFSVSNNRTLEIDSIRSTTNNYSVIDFNLSDEFIVDSYEGLINNIDSLGFLDKIIFTNRGVERTFSGFILYVGEKVPYRISQEVISYYLKLRSDIEIVLQLDESDVNLGSQGFNHYWSSQQIVIGSGVCQYSYLKRYVSNLEAIYLALNANSQKEFTDVFHKFDERKEEQINLSKKLLAQKLRLSGCEEIEEVGDRFRCSNQKALKWLEDNIIDKIDFTPKSKLEKYVTLSISREGKITNVRCYSSIPRDVQQAIYSKFRNMPLWIAPTNQNGEKIGSSISLLIFT